MFDCLNKQKYITISVLISLILGVGILAAALFAGLTAVDSAYTAAGLTLLSLVGFVAVRFTIPGPSEQAKAKVLHLVHPKK